MLQSKDDLLPSKGTHTIAVVNGPQNSGTLANSLKEVFKDVNDIQKNVSITIDETEWTSNCFLEVITSFCCWSLDSALLTLPMPACGSKFIRKTGIITDTIIKFLKEYYLQVILILFHQLHNITIKYYYL